MSGDPKHTNRLAGESSPYLLQHAHNPVDWYPWGDEAWEIARRENKMVLVSIGYAACHWCHVMERESFENEAIAARQNELAVNIKVDREERPDVDEIYMQAVQLLRGQGGWPLNVFCLPDGRPFFGGTYFPPERRMGMPSWPEVLEAVGQGFRDRRSQVDEQAEELVRHLHAPASMKPAAETPAAAVLASGARAVMDTFDARWGGFGGPPKFPQPYLLRLLLQHAAANDDQQASDQALFTLRKMAEGGMYDQLGGGFHRYSVDGQWLVPHFEKMLYDNALLVPLYLDAWRLSHDEFHARIARESLDYLLREMRSPEGVFYSSTDADSEGEEGKYFVWTPDETVRLLGTEEAEIFDRYYGVSPHGSFEDKSILHPTMSVEAVAKWYQKDETDAAAIIERGRATLLAERAGRVPPATDTKVIASWNGMAIDALAQGGAVLGEPRFTAAAEAAAAFLMEALRSADGLSRIYARGRASIPAFLEDYAALADGLLTLYEAGGDERWFVEARALAEEMLAKFWDEENGGFFTTGRDNEALITRFKPAHDGATPSGNSHAAKVLARLYALTGESLFVDRFEATARAHALLLERAPTAMPLLVTSLDWLRRHQTVALVGDPVSPAARALGDVVRRDYHPTAVLAQRALDATGAPAATQVPQLAGKELVDGGPAAYVCQGFSCSAPVTDPRELSELLRVPIPGSMAPTHRD